MRSLRYGVTILVLIALSMPYAASQESVADVVKQSTDAVVLIVISNSAGEETALGSGFLVSADGDIVTNYHVIKDAHSATVKLSNGAFFPVKGVLASDADKDLAIIKVDGKHLPFLSLGDSNKIRVGDRVVAIGSPLGLEGTASDGIISALRDVDNKQWIQTTAPVSHGNSGGSLLDMNNHVVGVVTWGVNLQLGQNLNFAAPCSEVTELLLTARKQTAPLDSIAASGTGLSGSSVWTSLTTGRDYDIRQDGNYLYSDWINVPAQVKAAGGFMRTELKKTSDGKWRGQTHSRLPCTYTRGLGAYAQNITNWCSFEGAMEIDLLSDKRIEGFADNFGKFDCRKCEPKEKTTKPFTLIPK